MKRLSLLWAAMALATPSPAPAGQHRTYLASIAGIALGPNEYVDSFAVDTWGVDMIAICHIPPGWQIRAGRRASLDGAIAGEASHGVTFLNGTRLHELDGLALIRIDGPVRQRAAGSQPATFAGQARIGRYGIDEHRRQAALSYRNIRLSPATRCPDPALR